MTGLFDNLPTKIIAMMLGFLLWFHVATEKTYRHQVVLPVNDIILDKELTLSKMPPDSVEVIVSASGKQLLRQTWRHEGLRINATSFPAGRHNLNLNMSNMVLIGAAELISLESVVFPTSIDLYVDRQSQIVLPVTADVTTLPAKGFAVKGISIPEPTEVVLFGPRSLLNSFTTVYTNSKELTGLRNSLTLTLPLKKPKGYGVRLEPDSVILRIEVVPIKSRVIDDIPIVLFNSPTDLNLVLKPAKVDITVSGPPDVVDSLDPTALVASSDFTAVTSRRRVAVKVDGPTAVLIIDQSVDSTEIQLK